MKTLNIHALLWNIAILYYHKPLPQTSIHVLPQDPHNWPQAPAICIMQTANNNLTEDVLSM